MKRVALADAELAIQAAIDRLMETPEALRCFVIVEDEVTQAIVQFRGSDGERLLIDTGTQKLPELWRRRATPCRREDAGLRAAEIFRQGFGLPAYAQLRVREESTKTGERN